jgi:hypothetical protein
MTDQTQSSNELLMHTLQLVQQELRAKMDFHLQACATSTDDFNRQIQALLASAYLHMVNEVKRQINSIERETGGNR